MRKLIAQRVPLGEIEGPGAYNPDKASSEIAPYTAGAERLISNVLAFLSIVGAIMFLVYFLLGGINWITAGGDQGKVETAKKYMTGAAIGLIVIAFSYSIAFIVSTVTGIDILNPGEIINNLAV